MSKNTLFTRLSILLILCCGVWTMASAVEFGTPVAIAEAEDGEFFGVRVSSNEPGYSGRGYVTGFDNDGDQVLIPIQVPEAGQYRLAIRYSNSSRKTQNVSVNEGFSFPVKFPDREGFTLADAGIHYFEKGENTVRIIKDWGWTSIDRVEIHVAIETSFDLADSPSDPQADSACTALYNWLKNQFGHRIISGQTDSYFEELSSLAGKTPLLRAGDLSPYTEGYAFLWHNGEHIIGKDPSGISEKLINWYNETQGKALIAFQWHWHSPSGGSAGECNFYTGSTSFDIRKAVTPGTEEYDDIIRDIDDIAVELAKFRDAGIPVLWRPLHEAGGGWFWWGAHGPEPCLELWNILRERLINVHGLHNLLWVWCTPEEDWYPGNDKVDIIGYDSYPGAYNYGIQRNNFDILKEISGGKKLIALTENGPIPEPDACLDEGAPWLFFMSWDDMVSSQNDAEHLEMLFANPDVVSLENYNVLQSSQWRSNLYPENWKPGYRDREGRYLHDFSHAGYHGAMDPLPEVTGQEIDVTMPPYNADATGVADATAAIQQALDDAGQQGGGIVYLPPGTYRLLPGPGNDFALEMKYSNVVLRGAGPDKSFLFNDDHQMRQKSIIYVAPNGADWFSPGGSTTMIRHDLHMPTRIVPLESVDDFKVGDDIVVLNSPTAEFIEEHGMTGMWDSSIMGVAFKRVIDSIDLQRRLLILDTPTRYSLKTRDQARVHKAKPHLHEIGLEGFSIGNRESLLSGWEESDYSIAGTGGYDAHASQAIKFEYVEDSWLKKIHTFRPTVNTEDVHILSNCLVLNMCRHVTVDSCDFQKPQYEGGGGNGYMYTLQANDCLIRGCRANDGRHNYDFKYPFSNGNVIHRCLSENAKYASDFHMYLSMSNLFDQMTLNEDYLESVFRPYGNPLHGHSSSESVFYNTYGEKYPDSKDYIIESRQYGWGYVIGTSGPADRIKTSPLSGTREGYSYDSSPKDFVEGIGLGEELYPPSLYLDQLERRKESDDRTHYNVEFLVLNNRNMEPIEGCLLRIYGDELLSDANGRARFTDVPESFHLEAQHEKYKAFPDRQMVIYSDTTISLVLKENTFALTIEVLDKRDHSPLPNLTIELDEQSESTNSEGIAEFSLFPGLHSYSIEKYSYAPLSGSIDLKSDSLVELYLERTHADAKIRLREGSTPVNKALVIVNEDSLVSSSLGLAKFRQLEVNQEYSYSVSLNGYKDREGLFYLQTDTTIEVAMEKIVDGLPRSHKEEVQIWPNPVHDILKLRHSGLYEKASICDLSGRPVKTLELRLQECSIPVGALEPGYYLLYLEGKNKKLVFSFLKT